MMENILRAINAFYEVDDATLTAFASRLKPRRLAKREVLISPGRRDANIYFIEQGITRSFTQIDGKEVTSWFSQEGDITYSTNAVYGATDGYEMETVQALEDSLLYYLPKRELEEVCQANLAMANWLRILYQRAFVETERRLIYRLYRSAEERYQDFLEKHPDLFQRVNLGHIASYLGMSQVTLCALRKG